MFAVVQGMPVRTARGRPDDDRRTGAGVSTAEVPFPPHHRMDIRIFRPLGRLGALAAFLLLGGCAVLEPEPDAADRRALSRARAQWERVGPRSYRYVYAPRCDCPPTVARATWVTVEQGVVVEASYLDGNEPVNIGPQLYGTVDSLFAQVQRAYDQHAAQVRVQYDPQLGYPIDVWIDWRRDVVDEESGFGASSLAPYTPVPNAPAIR
jgi:hypothetical protein